LMGEVSKTLVSLSGPDAVHGIIPATLIKHEQGGVTPEKEAYGKTTIVKDMHERKGLMASEVLAGGPGSGFIALPGGYGTIEELFEIVTWNQLGIHAKGIVVLNINGYFDGLLTWVQSAVEAGFVSEASSRIIEEAKTAEEALTLLRNYQPAEGRLKLQWGTK
jgi:uncharacterized protein (TIGR00730 family)